MQEFWSQLTFFARQEKSFSFFSSDRPPPPQTPPQRPAPGGCLCSTRKSSSEVPERGVLGKKGCLGRGGVDREKKEKKDAPKEFWSLKTDICGSLKAPPFRLLGSGLTWSLRGSHSPPAPPKPKTDLKKVQHCDCFSSLLRQLSALFECTILPQIVTLNNS